LIYKVIKTLILVPVTIKFLAVCPSLIKINYTHISLPSLLNWECDLYLSIGIQPDKSFKKLLADEFYALIIHVPF